MPLLELAGLVVDNLTAALVAARIVLVNRDPCPAETEVPIDAAVAFELVDTGPAGIARAATRVWIDGALAFDGNAIPEARPGFQGPRASTVPTSDSLRVVLDPILPWASQSLVTVRIVSATLDAAQTLDELYSFTIEDRTAPRVLAAQAIGPKTIEIAFDELLSIVDFKGITFEAIDLPAVPLTAIGAEVLGTIVRVDLDTAMTPDVHYRVKVTGVLDLRTNPPLPPFDQAVFAGFRPPYPKERRFSLGKMLPQYNRRADATGDLGRWVACLQEVTDGLLADVDRFSDLFDLERAPEPFLDAILQDLGNPFPFDLDALGKRRLASVLVEMYRQKGTAPGIRNAIRFFLGIDIEAITPFAGAALVLGESELGVDWELGPSERFARYAFDIRVGAPLTDTQRQHIRAIVNYLRPSHTHFLNLLEPGPPATFDHWELGISALDETTDLH